MSSLGPHSTCGEIVAHLEGMRNEANLAGMARFGIVTEHALGISNPDLQKIGRQIKRSHARAQELWRTGIREARLLAIYTPEPRRLTSTEAWQWANDFASWEIVDAAADLFVDARLEKLIGDFAQDEREFVRRTAFAMIAGAAVHLKKEPDATILAWLPLIETYSTDNRNFVKKAVNWALRNIGKRSAACHAPALALAQKLAAGDDRAARWNGRDAVRELTSARVLRKIGATKYENQ
jgi:3-methyladenine DNA glycosylase AlkD